MLWHEQILSVESHCPRSLINLRTGYARWACLPPAGFVAPAAVLTALRSLSPDSPRCTGAFESPGDFEDETAAADAMVAEPPQRPRWNDGDPRHDLACIYRTDTHRWWPSRSLLADTRCDCGPVRHHLCVWGQAGSRRNPLLSSQMMVSPSPATRVMPAAEFPNQLRQQRAERAALGDRIPSAAPADASPGPAPARGDLSPPASPERAPAEHAPDRGDRLMWPDAFNRLIEGTHGEEAAYPAPGRYRAQTLPTTHLPRWPPPASVMPVIMFREGPACDLDSRAEASITANRSSRQTR
jgi:hypothetical protein